MPNPILSTYRLQFRPEFTLEHAAGIVPYLNALGISHLYASPFLQSAPGSTHGYDVVDYSQINAELGGPAALNQLVEAQRGVSMGMLLDMVPNHMAISPRNPWWWDVLRNGPSSRFASYFDVAWNPPEARHENAVLVPVLGDHYGRVLEAGEVKVSYDGDVFTVHYFDHIYPVDPHSLGGILSAAAERSPNATLAFLAGAYDRLPEADATDLASARRRYRDTEVLRDMLARLVREQPEAGEAIQAVLESVNQDDAALDALLRRQNYRLALWKISSSELGYRRFFDINTMIGLRMEDPEVYRDTHLLVLDLLGRGVLDGLRIDHPDGLRDPLGYFNRLRQDADRLGRPDAWIGIEKILEPGERLPESWPVQGTVGYEFLNRLNGLFVDPQAETPLTDFYRDFTGQNTAYPDLVHAKKLLAAREVLGSDLNHLTELMMQICERHPNYRDYTYGELRSALAEVAACMPVYRTYNEMTPDDVTYITDAVEAAKVRRADLDPRLFDFIHDLLTQQVTGTVEHDLMERFQQYTGPVMAKGVEDTTFYIYNRFISLNEVGGDPGHFGESVADFHRANQATQARWPLTMLATSTHDTKRSEDVRARLNVLSERPGAWTDAVRRWAAMNARFRVPVQQDALVKEHGPARGEAIRGENKGTDRADRGSALPADELWPDRNTEYLLYQTLVGAWPIEEDRVRQYMEKAGREAKVYTSWTAPDEAYETAVANFIHAILANSRFTADLETFVAEILEAGRINALAQTLIKLTAPGIPDIYQGTELWSLALVDPDNRRPVDYELRRRLLEQLKDDTAPEAVLKHMDAGLPKLWVVRQALALRAAHPDWFGPRSSYTPLVVETAILAAPGGQAPEPLPSVAALAEEQELQLAVTGAHPDPFEDAPAVAYLRGEHVLTAVPRLTSRHREHWTGQRLDLPPGSWRSPLTHEVFQGRVTLADLWARFPVALLVKDEVN